jgi:alkanesulfonate monooxygenase SsuD/methylene tetrahydromethanopterin reductase-like flavin-dependent oxidoreductase (luciferase family)
MADLRWGLTLSFAGVPLANHGPLLQRAEAAGYDDVWSGETANGYDGFTPLALAAAHTERLRLVTGIVNPFTAARASWRRPRRRCRTSAAGASCSAWGHPPT